MSLNIRSQQFSFSLVHLRTGKLTLLASQPKSKTEKIIQIDNIQLCYNVKSFEVKTFFLYVGIMIYERSENET